MSTAPKKAIEVKVTANGFTWPDVIKALKVRVTHLDIHHENGAGVHADGYGASHTADVALRQVTREQFADESIAWLAQQKQQTADHVKCIRMPKEDEKHMSWCGRRISSEFHLQGLDHAAALQSSMTQPCPECVTAACAELVRLSPDGCTP